MNPSRVREVEWRRRRLDAVFTRAQKVTTVPDAAEIQSDYARFLCVLISGFVEKSVAALIYAHSDGKTSQPLRSLIEVSLKRLTNVNSDRLLNTMGALDKGWRDRLEDLLTDEQVGALDSIAGLRNDIAHGGGGSITLRGVTAYWQAAQEAIEHFEQLLFADPRRIAPSTKRAAP